MKNKQFTVIEEGTTYNLPHFSISEDGINVLKKYCLGKYLVQGLRSDVIEIGFHYSDDHDELVDIVKQLKSTESNFGDKELSYSYSVINSPQYECSQITFVRGSKDKDDQIPNVDGIVHEQLLGMMIHDLQYKNKLVPSRETSLSITKLEEALHWMQARQNNRDEREVSGTYKQ